MPSGNIYDKIPRRVATDATVEECADEWSYQCHLRRKPQDTDEIIRDTCHKGFEKGRASAPKSYKKVNKTHGKGKWKCNWRHAIWQGQHNKHRCVDDARRSVSTAAPLLYETIFCTPFDVPSRVLRRMRQMCGHTLTEEWKPSLGSEDQADAYRKIPTAARQRTCTVVGFVASDTGYTPRSEREERAAQWLSPSMRCTCSACRWW